MENSEYREIQRYQLDSKDSIWRVRDVLLGRTLSLIPNPPLRIQAYLLKQIRELNKKVSLTSCEKNETHIMSYSPNHADDIRIKVNCYDGFNEKTLKVSVVCRSENSDISDLGEWVTMVKFNMDKSDIEYAISLFEKVRQLFN